MPFHSLFMEKNLPFDSVFSEVLTESLNKEQISTYFWSARYYQFSVMQYCEINPPKLGI